MAVEILGLVTNVAKARFVDALINGYAIQVTHFAVGNQGHDPASPISSLTPDPGLNPTVGVTGDSLPEDMTFGPKLLAGASLNSDFCPVWTAVVSKGEATGELSSYYLLAKFVYPDPGSDTSHPLYGLYDKLWIFSYSYTPLSIKTNNESYEVQLGVQF